jgi:hypothetical protein
MPTPYDAPYKIEQRRLRAAAKNKPYSNEWYKGEMDRQKALIAAHRKMQARNNKKQGT